MSDDLPDRLRIWTEIDNVAWPVLRHDLQEAADEIGRLRTELDSEREAYAAVASEWKECEGVLDELADEREQLIDAIKRHFMELHGVVSPGYLIESSELVLDRHGNLRVVYLPLSSDRVICDMRSMTDHKEDQQ